MLSDALNLQDHLGIKCAGQDHETDRNQVPIMLKPGSDALISKKFQQSNQLVRKKEGGQSWYYSNGEESELTDIA